MWKVMNNIFFPFLATEFEGYDEGRYIYLLSMIMTIFIVTTRSFMSYPFEYCLCLQLLHRPTIYRPFLRLHKKLL